MDQYRFENGSLFELCEESNAYIFCFKHCACTTKREAITEYEKSCDEYDLVGNTLDCEYSDDDNGRV